MLDEEAEIAKYHISKNELEFTVLIGSTSGDARRGSESSIISYIKKRTGIHFQFVFHYRFFVGASFKEAPKSKNCPFGQSLDNLAPS